MTIYKQNPFRVHSLKIHKNTLRQKSKQRQRGSGEMLMLVISGVKSLEKV